jgi:hypothetical protein
LELQQGTALAASSLYRKFSYSQKKIFQADGIPLSHSTSFGKPLPQLFRLHALLPQLPQAQRIMPLRQPDVLFIAQQRTMKILWHRISQRSERLASAIFTG